MLPGGLDTYNFLFGASGGQLRRENGNVYCIEKDASLKLFTLQWSDRNGFFKSSLFTWFCFSRGGLAV